MSKLRIMIVEDERVVAADIQECVAGLGYEVVGSAASGIEALEMIVATEPDLVLMDIKLKGNLDGIDVAGALYDQLKIPVVYLTAHADAEILKRAKRTAPAGYVLKPFDDRTLSTAIEMAFDRHRRERQLIEGSERLATAIGSIDEAVIVTQDNGQVAVMNRMAETLTGWRQDEALGRNLGEVFTLLNARTGAPQASPVGRVFREGVAIALGEAVVLLGRDGSRMLIQGTAAPVRDGETKVVGACLLFRGANQRSADEAWGTPNHGSTSRMEILGRLTAAVAQRFSRLLEGSRGRSRAARLANRLLEFGQRQPSEPARLNLNGLISGLDELLQCAMGDNISLRLDLDPGAPKATADPGQIELMLMHLAISARESAYPGQFSIETSRAAGLDADGAYAIVSVTPPFAGSSAALMLPALDEIIGQSTGEIRLSSEHGSLQIYLPSPA